MCTHCKTAVLVVAVLQWLLAFDIFHIKGKVHGLLVLIVLHRGKGSIRQGQHQQLLQISRSSLGSRGGMGPVGGSFVPTTPWLLLLQTVEDTQQQLCQPSLAHLSQAAAGVKLAQDVKEMAVSHLADTKQRPQRLRRVEDWQAGVDVLQGDDSRQAGVGEQGTDLGVLADESLAGVDPVIGFCGDAL